MANDFKNTSLVTKWAVKAFINALKMGEKIDRQLDDSRVFSGAKVGATASIRRPVMFEATASASFNANDIEEGIVSVTVNNRQHVGFEITDEDMSLKIEDANERYIIPAMNELAQVYESAIAAKYTEIPNFVGTPGTTPSTFLDVANAEAELHKLGVPEEDELYAFYDSKASVQLANGLKGVFPQDIAKTAIENAKIGRYGGMNMFRSNSLKSHTVGAATGTILVDDAGTINVTYAASKDTDTQTLNLDGVADTSAALAFLAGDVITLAGVNSVNRRTREDTGDLQTFVVTEDSIASTGTTDNIPVTIAPPIIISGPYQTVTAAPADGAVVTIKTGTAGVAYKQNLAWHRNAITSAFVPLDVAGSGSGVDQARENFKGISITSTRWFDGNDMTMHFRFDILFDVFVQNRSFAVRTTG
jgi:hypothetical protein